jgi:hypothetical protein
MHSPRSPVYGKTLAYRDLPPSIFKVLSHVFKLTPQLCSHGSATVWLPLLYPLLQTQQILSNQRLGAEASKFGKVLCHCRL